MPRQLTSKAHICGETTDGLFVLRLRFVDDAKGGQLIEQLPDGHRLHLFAQLVDAELDVIDVSFGTSCYQTTSGRGPHAGSSSPSMYGTVVGGGCA